MLVLLVLWRILAGCETVWQRPHGFRLLEKKWKKKRKIRGQLKRVFFSFLFFLLFSFWRGWQVDTHWRSIDRWRLLSSPPWMNEREREREREREIRVHVAPAGSKKTAEKGGNGNIIIGKLFMMKVGGDGQKTAAAATPLPPEDEEEKEEGRGGEGGGGEGGCGRRRVKRRRRRRGRSKSWREELEGNGSRRTQQLDNGPLPERRASLLTSNISL